MNRSAGEVRMQKLLIALDCSAPSMRAAEYAAEIVPHLPGCEVVLFTVLTGIPYGEGVLTELTGTEPVELHGDEDFRQEVDQVRAFLAATAHLFAGRRLPEERLTILAKPLRRGIAQDILEEAHANECDTVVVGRRGLSKVQEMVMGSVSRDLVHKAEGLAIWVVD
jgi:nucleotide-binding universal stress UspA family protein